MGAMAMAEAVVVIGPTTIVSLGNARILFSHLN